MRRFLLFSGLSLTTLAVAGVGVGVAQPAVEAIHPIASAAQAQFLQVNIRVSCDADNQVDEVSIQPWTVRASRQAGQQLRWRLLPGSGVSSATIRPKDSSSWPFASTPPLTVPAAGGAAVDSGPITGADGTYYYDIVVDCGAGPTVIDPRMDIGP